MKFRRSFGQSVAQDLAATLAHTKGQAIGEGEKPGDDFQLEKLTLTRSRACCQW